MTPDTRRTTRRPLVVVDLESLVWPTFGAFMCKSLHADTAPDRPLRVVGPDDVIGDAAGVVVTGSEKMLGEDTDWAKGLAKRLEEAARRGTPVLGICFGHQLLCWHFGGRLARWPAKREGIAEVSFAGDGEVRGGPFGAGPAQLFLTHSDRVEAAGEMQVLADGGFGGVQATRHPELPIWTIQAHPESRASFLDYLPDEVKQGVPPEWLPRIDTPDGKAILRRFGKMLKD